MCREDRRGEGELLRSGVGPAPGRAAWGPSAEGDVGAAGASLGSGVGRESGSPASGLLGFRHFLRGRRAELGPARLMASGRKSPHAGREGWRHPSGNRPAFAFLGHFSKILFTVLILRGGELSALAVEGKPFVASWVPGGPCLGDLGAQKTLLHRWGVGVVAGGGGEGGVSSFSKCLVEGTLLFRKQTRNKPTKTIPSLQVNERNFIFPGLAHCQSCGPGLWSESRCWGDRPPPRWADALSI